MKNDKPPDWGQAARVLTMFSEDWQNKATEFRHLDFDLGHLNTDFVSGVASHFRELARLAEFTADACREIAFAQEQDAAADGSLLPCAGDCPQDGAA